MESTISYHQIAWVQQVLLNTYHVTDTTWNSRSMREIKERFWHHRVYIVVRTTTDESDIEQSDEEN